MINRRATYGVGRSSILIDRINKKPVVALSAAFQSSPLILLTKKSSGIDAPKDLIGKKIMVSNDEVLEVSIFSMLLSQGVRKQDVKLLPHTFTVKDLIVGEIDAMTAYISNQPFSY